MIMVVWAGDDTGSDGVVVVVWVEGGRSHCGRGMRLVLEAENGGW